MVPLVPIAINVLKVLFRNLGGHTPKPIPSSVKNATVMDTPTSVITMQKSPKRVFPWTSTEIWKVAAFAKNAKKIPKASIVTLAFLAFLGPLMSYPMLLILANVSFEKSYFILLALLKVTFFVACDCGDDPRYSGNCEAGGGQCECKEAFRGAEDCSACADGFYDYPDCKPCDCFANGTE